MHEVAVGLAAAMAPSVAAAAAASGAWVAWALRRPAPALGARAPAFEGLPGTDGEVHGWRDFAGARAVVVLFTANRCPGAKAYDGRMRDLVRDFAGRGVAFVAINPIDDRLYPSESVPAMAAAARERELPLLGLKDPTQAVAAAFGAACTPHVFVLDARRRVRYRGRIDDSFVPGGVTRSDLREALADLLAGRAVRVPETPPLGCSIDWTRLPAEVPALAPAP